MEKNKDAKIAYTFILCVVISCLLCVLIVIFMAADVTTKARIETLKTEIVEIRKLLEMFEEATPSGKEVIYLDEDMENWLDNDMITGDIEND